MNILISHTSLYQKKGDSIYLGRGKQNQFPLLANDWSHKEGTQATYRVATVEDAVENFKANLYRCTRSDVEGYREQLRGLYELSKEIVQVHGRVVYLCWCKDEFAPKPWHHGCHCEVLRDVILSKYRKDMS